MPQRTLAYSVVDVFAEHALEGNPLAIFHDARSLSSDEMQALCARNQPRRNYFRSSVR